MECMYKINSHRGSVRADVPSAPGVGLRLAKAWPFESAAVLASFWIRCAQCRRAGSLASRRRTRLEPMSSLSLVFKFRRSFDADFHGRRLPQRRHRNHGFGTSWQPPAGSSRSRAGSGRGHFASACRATFSRASGSVRRDPDGHKQAATARELLPRRWVSCSLMQAHARPAPTALRWTPFHAQAARSPAAACRDALTVRHADT
jgi:hypothetical protein